MTLHLVPATLALIVGLLAGRAVDFQDGGGVHPLAWAAFALALALVARDTLLGGSFIPHRDEAGGFAGPLARSAGARRHGGHFIDWSQGDVRIRIVRLEPVATTVAILLGLAASQAVNFSDAAGGTTGLGWAAFALSLFLALGGRLTPRPRRPNRRATARRSNDSQRRTWEAMGDEFEARVAEAVEELRRGFGRD